MPKELPGKRLLYMLYIKIVIYNFSSGKISYSCVQN